MQSEREQLRPVQVNSINRISWLLNFCGVELSRMRTYLSNLSGDLWQVVQVEQVDERQVQVLILGMHGKGEEQVIHYKIDALIQEIKRDCDCIYIGQGIGCSIEERVVELLKQKGKNLVCAESLTGGLVSQSLTAIVGSSAVIKGAYVVYQAQAKVTMLGIDQALIDRFSVYSHQCAQAMAEQALKLSGADLAISLTGVAGPGSDLGHPAGEVYIATAGKGLTTISKQLQIQSKDRQMIRLQSEKRVLELLIQNIEQ